MCTRRRGLRVMRKEPGELLREAADPIGYLIEKVRRRTSGMSGR
jgi:hypothetical protein